MKTKLTPLLAILIAASALLVVGCSDDGGSAEGGIVEQVIDSVTLSVVDNLSEAQMVNETTTDEAEVVSPGELQRFNIDDILIANGCLYAAYDGGLALYDIASKQVTDIQSPERISAVELYQDRIYVGGENLYTVVEENLIPVGTQLSGSVTSLTSYAGNLIIGTEEQVVVQTDVGAVELLSDVDVTDISVFDDVLWIGTNGQGLFSYDGEEVRERFLRRDSSIFDFVTAVTGGYNHLYVGTPNGLFIYDGGRWQELGIGDGLPSPHVTAIDADGWVVYVGTTGGLTSWYQDELISVDKLHEQSVTSLARMGRKLIVGTETEGVLMKSGKMLKTMIEPERRIEIEPETVAISH